MSSLLDCSMIEFVVLLVLRGDPIGVLILIVGLVEVCLQEFVDV